MKKLKVLLALGLCLVCLPKMDSFAYEKTFQVYDPLKEMYLNYFPDNYDPFERYLPKDVKSKVYSGKTIAYSNDGCVINRNGYSTALTYDSAGNIIAEKVSYYNPESGLSNITDANFSYDSYGRVISEQIVFQEGFQDIYSIVYDDINKTIKRTSTYYENGLTSVVTNETYCYQLNENGKISSISSAVVSPERTETATYTYTYSSEGYVTGINVIKGAQAHSYTYTYDAMGNPLTVSEDGKVTKENTYTYDSYGRVISDGTYTYTYY